MQFALDIINAFTTYFNFQGVTEYKLRTYPLHFLHRAFRDKDSFLVVPLYTSSKVTFIGRTTSSPRFCLRPLELPPVNHKIKPHISTF
jgi:hypothetical protein